jgi:hypothetical protein
MEYWKNGFQPSSLSLLPPEFSRLTQLFFDPQKLVVFAHPF